MTRYAKQYFSKDGGEPSTQREVVGLDGNGGEFALCPLRHALSIIGGKWKLPIICFLSSRTPARYSAIKRNIPGITNMMLSQSLKELENFGIVLRKQYNQIPPRVEYALTADGESLLPALELLAKWGFAQLYKNTAGSNACETCRREN
ncbi:MAG: helix-turn-helix transcriptional regulator [Acidaminococcales bacterium]|jgi:DNA-binding HxlR family transcriptional regulator|nr:helix-turn-helix transcriptional regulator [Acidaminococcales bacterium]